jgi:hypothetical protein
MGDKILKEAKCASCGSKNVKLELLPIGRSAFEEFECFDCGVATDNEIVWSKEAREYYKNFVVRKPIAKRSAQR